MQSLGLGMQSLGLSRGTQSLGLGMQSLGLGTQSLSLCLILNPSSLGPIATVRRLFPSVGTFPWYFRGFGVSSWGRS